MYIGPYKIKNQTILAPMAGVTDLPFRQICFALGAGMTVSEMVSSNSLLRSAEKTLRKTEFDADTQPRVVQIAGANPELLAEAAQFNVNRGAEIIDINMGCPVKKVCNADSGSALLRNEPLIEKILNTVTKAVNVPVTLKIRTGWDTSTRNGVRVAKLAENCGVQSLTVHGRTRCCFFKGEAEYETISEIKKSVKIPVIANGDITSPQKAKYVLDLTKADAVMIGRASYGNPWIFEQINHYLQHDEILPPPAEEQILAVILRHMDSLYKFYGEDTGIKMVRKHIGWYCKQKPYASKFRSEFNNLANMAEQKTKILEFFE